MGVEVLVLLFVAYGVFWVWMLVEIATRPDRVYREAGQSKALWLVVVLALQFFGTLGYFFMVRKELQDIERRAIGTSAPL